MNRVILSGKIAKENPVVREIKQDFAVVNFSIAETIYKGLNEDGSKNYDTQFHEIVATNAKARFIQKYFKKGSPIEIDGKLINRTYQDKDGNNRKVTEVRVDDVKFPPKQKDETPVTPSEIVPPTQQEDDLPF